MPLASGRGVRPAHCLRKCRVHAVARINDSSALIAIARGVTSAAAAATRAVSSATKNNTSSTPSRLSSAQPPSVTASSAPVAMLVREPGSGVPVFR